MVVFPDTSALARGEPDSYSTHPDVVWMKPSRMPRHVLRQVCVLNKAAEKERAEEVSAQYPKPHHGPEEVQQKYACFSPTCKRSLVRFFWDPILKGRYLCLPSRLLVQRSLFLGPETIIYVTGSEYSKGNFHFLSVLEGRSSTLTSGFLSVHLNIFSPFKSANWVIP